MVENVTEETTVRMVRNWVEYGAEAIGDAPVVRPHVPVVMVVTGGRAQLQAIGDAGR